MKRQLTTLGFVLSLTFIILYIFSSNFGQNNLDILKIVSNGALAALITFIGYALFNYWLWRINPFIKLIKRPVIAGTWIADVEEQGEKYQIQLKIKQRYYDVSLRLTGPDFASNSLLSQMIFESGGHYLYFIYLSKPRSRKNKSETHHGTCRLHCQDDALSGIYFTSSGDTVDITFYKKGI